MNENDLRNQFKVIDMMTTMHSALFNSYKKKYQVIDLVIFASSVAVLSMTFSDQEVLSEIGINGSLVKGIVGISSLVIFILSIFSLIVDWKGRYAQHREAFNVLVGIKSEWRSFLAAIGTCSDKERAEFSKYTSLRLGSLVEIPESKFNKLKAAHYRKVTISKLISKNPGSSLIIVRIRVFVTSNYKVLAGNRHERN